MKEDLDLDKGWKRTNSAFRKPEETVIYVQMLVQMGKIPS